MNPVAEIDENRAVYFFHQRIVRVAKDDDIKTGVKFVFCELNVLVSVIEEFVCRVFAAASGHKFGKRDSDVGVRPAVEKNIQGMTNYFFQQPVPFVFFQDPVAVK